MSRSAGTLDLGEPHPAARDALRWLRSLPPATLMVYQSAFSSLAAIDNRLAEICAETLRRILAGEPISDRYLLGLAWTIRAMEGGAIEVEHD